MIHRRRKLPDQLPLPLEWPPAKPEPAPFLTGPVAAKLRELNRCSGPVIAPILADFLGKSERTARYYLRELEQAGLVYRPAGPRSGWMVVR